MSKSFFAAGLAVAGVVAGWSGCSSSASGPATASSGGFTGAGGSGGAGMGGASANFTCTVPATPPSKGACVTFHAPGSTEGDAGVDSVGDATTTTCNPITNAGCIGTDVCGADTDATHYYCLPAGTPPAVPVCGDCSATEATCGPGLACLYVTLTEAYCAAMCCTDADCGAGGKCDTKALMAPFEDDAAVHMFPSDVGICD